MTGVGVLTRAYLLETWRSKPALFWNLAFPLVTLVGLAYVFGGGQTERVRSIVPGVMTITLLAGALFGVSLHMVSLRESGLYRRYRVTPVTSLAVVVAHAITGALNALVSLALQVVVARVLFGVDVRGAIPALAVVVPVSAFGLIPLGLLIGSVARDMRSGPAISNLVFFLMMFLSGAAMPLFLMPAWLKRVAEFVTATYVVELLQAIIIRGESLYASWFAAVVLLATGLVAFAANGWLFRWEGAEPVDWRALAVSGVTLSAVYVAAFLYGPTLKSAAAPPVPPTARYGPNAVVLRGMTVLDGEGHRLEPARVVIDGDRIVDVGVDVDTPVSGSAVVRDLSGLYMIPGLIESHTHLGGSAGGSASLGEYVPARVVRDLQVYLALGVTSVLSLTDDYDDLVSLRRAVAAGRMRAPRPFFSGPGLTSRGGHPARLFRSVPGLADRLTRQVSKPREAEQAVRELAGERVDIVKFFLEEGWIGERVPPLSEEAFRAGMRTARQLGLRTTAHVDGDAHARLAIDAGVDGLEHVPPDLSDETIALMIKRRVTLTPTLAAYEGLARAVQRTPVTDPLVLEWVDHKMIDSLAAADSWIATARRSPAAVQYYTERNRKGTKALCRAVERGVRIIAGSDAGNPGAFHGPGLLRELELMVDACRMAPGEALLTATGHAADRLGRRELGRIAPNAVADLVVLGADPTSNIRALRDIRYVYFGGKEIDRQTLLSSSPGDWMPGNPD